MKSVLGILAVILVNYWRRHLSAVPNYKDICIWSPRLDDISIRPGCIEMAVRLTQTDNLHLYASIAAASDKIVRLAHRAAYFTCEAL